MNLNKLKKVFIEFCRLLLGITFVFSGITKAIDPVGGAIKIADYLVAFKLDALKELPSSSRSTSRPSSSP